MRRLQHLALTVSMAAFALGSGGCTDAGSNLLILGNRAPVVQNNACIFDTNIQGGVISAGLFDIDSPFLYTFAPVIQNAAPGIANDINQNVVLIEGFDVKYNYLGGFLDAVPDAQREILVANSETTVLRAVSVAPNGGLSTVIVDLFNEPIISAINASGVLAGGARAIVEVEVTAFGTIDGGTLESTPFNYPVTLCDGCYVVNQGLCTADLVLGGGYHCGGFQDFPILCCDNGGTLACGEE